MADTPATPENNLDSVETADLETEVSELRADFGRLYDEGAPLPELNEIAAKIEAIDTELESRHAAAEAEAAERTALADKIAAAAPVEVEAEVEAEAEVVAEAEAIVEEAAEEVEVVTASAPAPSARNIARRTVTPVAPDTESNEMVITASADVPGFSNGQRIDRFGIATAMHARARGMGDSKGRETRFGVASIESGIAPEFQIKDGSDNADAIVAAAVASQLSGQDAQSLVASGGWCAPSENMYDLFNVESRDGLLDLPTVGVARGGTNVPAYIGVGDIDGALWSWDETKDNNTPTDSKPCLQLPCPSFTDVRLEAEGLCVTAGNLTDRAFPELTARTVDLTVTAHLHRLSSAKIAKIVASATAVAVTTVPSDAAGDILNAIDLQVADYRSQYLLGEGTVLDAILPHWFRGAIRSTLAMRAGIEAMAVTDAMVTEYFTVRQIRPQFVYGYEALFNTTPAVAWPTTSKVLLYPTGSYVAGDGGNLDLGVVRDSTLNATNDFTAAWSESFYSVIQRGPAAREITVSTNVDGQTGGPEFAGA
jgi:hypothetical protein